MAGYLAYSLFKGPRAPRNPWGGGSFEWDTPSPPRHDNFAEPPAARDPYDFDGLVRDEAEGGYVRRD